MASFTTQIKVRFAHTDPAGILFYPRYFEMVNQVVEDWFDDALGHDYRAMVIDNRMGIPAVHVDADFHSPSELGDVIDFTLVIEHLGRSSCRLRINGSVGARERLTARLTIAYVSLKERKARSWPEELRSRMDAFLESETIAAS